LRVAACSWTAFTTSGWQWPRLTAAIPATKSRYSRPSSSQTRVPSPLTSVIGNRLPTGKKCFASGSIQFSLIALRSSYHCARLLFDSRQQGARAPPVRHDAAAAGGGRAKASLDLRDPPTLYDAGRAEFPRPRRRERGRGLARPVADAGDIGQEHQPAGGEGGGDGAGGGVRVDVQQLPGRRLAGCTARVP